MATDLVMAWQQFWIRMWLLFQPLMQHLSGVAVCMLDLQLYLHNNQSEVYVGERRVAVRNSTNNGINKKLHVMI
jgi:hypothetical protein